MVITLDDGTTEFRLSDIGTGISSAEILTDTGQLQFTLTDGSTITSSNPVAGRDGNGIGIETATFVDGVLTFTLSDATGSVVDTIVAGDVSMVSVTNARIVENTTTREGILYFDLSDGNELEIGNVYGRDGRFVESISLDVDQNLLLTMSNGDVVNAGSAKGDDGITLESAEVLLSGDLLVTYSNGTTDNAGNIGSGAGLTVWNVDQTPYVKDRVVIYDGGLYMSKIDGNSDQPPSANWTPLALGDQIIEIRKPSLISPISGNTAYSIRPTLKGSLYAPIVSIDKRDYREFQITTDSDIDFAAVLFTYQSDSDDIEVLDDLTTDTTYRWRCRDISERQYISIWSESETFYVPTGVITTPTVSITPEENVDMAYASPLFIGSAYLNEFDATVHNSTDWVITDPLTDVVIWENLNDTVNLTTLRIPFGVLSPSTSYALRIKYRSTDIESAWSEPLLFTTEDTFDYVDKPVIYYDGDITEVKSVNPVFNASTFRKAPSFIDSTHISLVHVSSEWEVLNQDTNEIVETNIVMGDSISYTINTPLNNNVNYRIRVRYESAEFGKSAWSDYLDFIALQTIDAPTVTTTEDINGFPDGGVFTGSTFVGKNEQHVSTDWQILDFYTDQVVYEELQSTANLTSLAVTSTMLVDGDYKIRVRYNGNDIVSEWSTLLDFYFGSPA